ncbi:hypothetical protein DSECCO2_553240 [anaerobic digester metagenome]
MIGLDVFKEYFRDYAQQYVLIGGAACDIIFEEQDTAFRATKDLDMVLIVEALTSEFGRRFWQFVRDGGYENRAKSTGAPQFYRFEKPKTAGFPYMIELFSRMEDTLCSEDEGPCIPLPLGEELSSLSAILLNEDYYSMLLKGRTVLSDIAVLSHTYLIPFKAKAWLDLRDRKSKEQHVDEKDIRKHKNDILRLATLLAGTEQCELSEPVRRDIALFIDNLRSEPVDLKALKVSGITFEDILTVLEQVYLG